MQTSALYQKRFFFSLYPYCIFRISAPIRFAFLSIQSPSICIFLANQQKTAHLSQAAAAQTSQKLAKHVSWKGG
jgi:hypothetical protein